MKQKSSANNEDKLRNLAIGLFLVLWAYLFFRAFSVFYLHDELVSKWSYMINWNAFPSQGYIDANNHFLLSFFGGLFIRIFHSDSLLVIRLASLLAFPIYFWSIYQFKGLFRQKWNFYGLLIGLVCTSFILEYFALARGYGLSFAFMLLALQQTISLIENQSKKTIIVAAVGWVLAVSANLTLIPFALAGMVILIYYSWKRFSKWWLLGPISGLICLSYFVGYSFKLKTLGKLYYGGDDGFVETTLHSLTPYIWNVKHYILDIVIILVGIFILTMLFYSSWKKRQLFNPRSVFSLFFLLALFNVFAQSWLLNINYPEDRTALYLVIFFIGGLFFAIDETTKKPLISIGYIILTITLFIGSINTTHSIFHSSEYISIEMLRAIPEEVNGVPPTSGSKWNGDHEMVRVNNLQTLMFQEINSNSDTLLDYMICSPERCVGITKKYIPVMKDEISGRNLYKRKNFLKRTKIDQAKFELFGKNEFLDLKIASIESPLLLTISGQMNQMKLDQDMYFVFSSKDTLTNEIYTYDAFSVIQNCKIKKDNSVRIDFSFALQKVSKSNVYSVCLWNKSRDVLSGIIELEVYLLGD